MNITLDDQFQTNPDVITTQLEDDTGQPESVLLHLTTHQYFSLNATGVSIWNNLEQGLPLSAVADELQQAYDVTPEQAKSAVLRLTGELLDAKLIKFL